jgi:hypothetical protein
MAHYKVLSAKVSGKNPGDLISDDDLVGVNVEALIEAGHIAPASKNKKNDDPKVEV